jgi:hypothetical protein
MRLERWSDCPFRLPRLGRVASRRHTFLESCRPRTTSTRRHDPTWFKKQQLLAVRNINSPCRRTCPTSSQTQHPNTTHSGATSYPTESTATPKTTLTCVEHSAHTTPSRTKPFHLGCPTTPSAQYLYKQHRLLHPVCDSHHHNKHPQSMPLKEVDEAV